MQNEEKLLLVIIVGTSSAMLVQAGQYVPEARVFPQAAAVVTLFFATATVVQNRFELSGGSDLIGRVQDEAVAGVADSDSESSTDDGVELGKSESGEFRISQPTSPYRVPFTHREIPKRTALGALLTLYLGLVWLSGIFLSSVVFIALYASVMDLRRKATLLLIGFTVGTLLLFNVWLGTPLFRPAHELFTLPEVPL